MYAVETMIIEGQVFRRKETQLKYDTKNTQIRI